MDLRNTVYIDESGSTVLDETCYVICAVICNADDEAHDMTVVQYTRENHRQGAELKSSQTGSRFEQRINICTNLAQLKSRCVVLVIRKDRLAREGGFRFKPSTYKYCQRRLFEKVYQGMSQITVILDQFGSQEFMKSFAPYIDRNFKPTLFSSKKINYSTPTVSPMLQVADYVAGTVRRFVQNDDPPEAYKALEPILSVVESWPRLSLDPHIDLDASSLDHAIYQHCIHAAEEHLESQTDNVLREALEYLLYSVSDEEKGFIYGDRLLAHLKAERLVDESRDKGWLRQAVIAELRKHGVPLAASRDGYKIPTSRDDLAAFVEFVADKTIPYLERVNKMRNSIFLGTGLTYDMLEVEPRLYNLMKPLNREMD